MNQLFTDILYKIHLFICSWPLRPLITQCLAYDNKKLTTNKGQKLKTLPISARERCGSPSNHMLRHQNICPVSNVLKFFQLDCQIM